jgi:hypothetical protein
MAIIVKEPTEKINWFPISIGAFALVFVGITVYFLFFTSAPLIERVDPNAQNAQNFEEIVGHDPTAIDSDPSFRSLEKRPNPETGVLGRPNPFAPAF